MAEKKTAEWIKVKPQELEKLIVDLHKEGNSPAKIGLILRDKHGIPKAKLIGKRITKVLAENKLEWKSEKDDCTSKIHALESHIVKHKHDYTAKRSLTKSLWAVKKLN